MRTHSMLFLVLVALLSIFDHCLAAFVSIDCGSSVPITDEFGVKWTADDGYVQTGELQTVEYSSTIPSYMSETVMSSLRVFPNLKKNCYTINVNKGEKVLVRASFIYGNYDGKLAPPTFELQFDGNFWSTVNTSELSGVYPEALYVMKENTTSICLAQTFPNQIPFISALELRSLDSDMYSRVDPNLALFFSNRVASGAKQTTRYPDDIYDRIWTPEVGFGGLSESMESVAVSIDTTTTEDKPPLAVLLNAVGTTGRAWGLGLTTNLPNTNVPVYIATYFSEVAQLNLTDKRSIRILVDKIPYGTPVIPPFGSVSVVEITNMTASSSTNFDIAAASDSTLPPIINAYEVYTVSNALTDGTNRHDVEGLEALRKEFDLLKSWSGDPCLPSRYTWEWLDCNTDASPRVTALNLSSFGLSGSLPDFSSLDALETIDLHNNSIHGPIPNFLGSLPNLKLLILEDNRFNGTIPSSISKNKKLTLIITNNCLSGMSCKPETLPSPTKSPLPVTPSSGTSDTPKSLTPPSGTSDIPEPLTPPSDQQDQNQIPFFNGGKKSDTIPIVLGLTFQVSLLLLLLRQP
ncbi:Leucine-rich repeat receptor-like protein kinase [Quillaja saponaria]|uniref:Leucine-rich repeat receptor-like protein kinase n=1 Tax=Quillaja saponaria TaxID=32244 RepID=A0AAD7Q6A1_QUISA|nr:Leucine-rich repeat receptor-like protein kinase [Quillaja saponaria]